MKNFLNLLERALTFVMACTVAVLIIPVCLQIFSRFTDLIPRYIWTEELSRFCFVWMVMIGAMIGVRERLHFDVDVWPQLSPRTDALLRMVANGFVFLFAAAMVWWGVQFTQFGWNQTSELAELPMWIIFIAWPLTGLVWLLFLVEAFARDLEHYKRRTAIAGAVAPGALV